jgi:hypothetical protein
MGGWDWEGSDERERIGERGDREEREGMRGKGEEV